MAEALLRGGRELPPLPDEMKHLDRDSRGLPIPFLVARGVDGRPDFRINDHSKLMRCLSEGLCTISGLPMGDADVWFVGGNQAAYHPVGAYLDPPGKKVCLTWALQVCPFLIARSYTMKTVNPKFEQDPKVVYVENSAAQADLPEYFVLARTDGFVIQEVDTNQFVFSPNRPWLEAEHWQHGERLSIRRRPDILKEMAIMKDEYTGEVPVDVKRRNRGKGKRGFPWTKKK